MQQCTHNEELAAIELAKQIYLLPPAAQERVRYIVEGAHLVTANNEIECQTEKTKFRRKYQYATGDPAEYKRDNSATAL